MKTESFMRNVVDSAVDIGARQIEQLSCGHAVVRNKNRPAKRRRCAECAQESYGKIRSAIFSRQVVVIEKPPSRWQRLHHWMTEVVGI